MRVESLHGLLFMYVEYALFSTECAHTFDWPSPIVMYNGLNLLCVVRNVLYGYCLVKGSDCQ